MSIYGHSLGYYFRYCIIVLILAVSYDQLERILLKDVT